MGDFSRRLKFWRSRDPFPGAEESNRRAAEGIARARAETAERLRKIAHPVITLGRAKAYRVMRMYARGGLVEFEPIGESVSEYDATAIARKEQGRALVYHWSQQRPVFDNWHEIERRD